MSGKTFRQLVDEEVARLRKEVERAERPRYRGGARLTETIKMYCRPSNPKLIEFAISFDLVEYWWQLRENRPKDKMPKHYWDKLRVQFVSFQNAAIPGCLLRLEPYTFWQTGKKLTRSHWRFTTTIAARAVGLKAGVPSQTLDFMPWEDHKGVVLMFRDEDWDIDGTCESLYTSFARDFAEQALAEAQARNK